MAISVNWPTGVVSIPLADLTLVSGTIYKADTNAIRLELKGLEDSIEGMPWPRITRHNTEVTVAGVTFARTIEVINNYSIQFTPDSQATVILEGSNNNFFDVENGILVQNQVQVISTNSAGLQKVTSGSGVLPSDVTDIKNAVIAAIIAEYGTDYPDNILELWRIAGLDISNPMTVTPTSRDAGTISQDITGDGETTTTVTRT